MKNTKNLKEINDLQWKTNKTLRKSMMFDDKPIKPSENQWNSMNINKTVRKSMISNENIKKPQGNQWETNKLLGKSMKFNEKPAEP